MKLKRLTLLHLVHCYTIGGAEAVINYICRYSPDYIHNIVCSFYEPDLKVARVYHDGTETVYLNKHRGNDFKAVLRLAEIINSKNVDIVHAQGWATYIEGLMAVKLSGRKKCRFVYAFHGKTMKDVQNGIPWRRRAAQKIASEFADAIIAPSCQMADDYVNTIGINRKRVQVIYNGIDFSSYGKCYTDSRKHFNISSDDFVIGFVGRLDPVKNLEGLIKAFNKALSKVESALKNQRFFLIIVGDGSEMMKLKNLAKSFDLEKNIIFTGMRNDVPLCLSAMDVYVQPSFYEGHSNTILEAMAASLPVISTNTGGTPEIIEHGKTGILLDPNDIDGISDTISSLLHDKEKREAMGKAGTESARKRFSVGNMVNNYISLFYKVSNY